MLISVVIPCYNESAVLRHLHERLLAVLTPLTPDNFEIIYVDDGSQDDTPAQLYQLSLTDPRLKVLRLSRNFGQEAAMSAGLTEAVGDAVVIIDADLQDPPELIAQMYEHWREGWQIVFGERQDRAGEKRFKLWAAETFYRVLGGLSASVPHQAGNFRLMDRGVVEAFLQMPERIRFVRGMIGWVGFKQMAIPYRRAPRFAGTSKYSLAKMFSLATDAVTSFSFAPLRLATIAGLGIFVAAFIELTISLPAPNMVLFAILLLGGTQLLSIGIIGEYLGRIFMEVKRRPFFVVSQRYGPACKRADTPGSADDGSTNVKSAGLE